MVQIFYSVSEKELDELKEVKNLNDKNEILKSTRSERDIDKSWEILQFLLMDEVGPCEHPLSNIFHPKNSTLSLTEAENAIFDRDDYYQCKEFEAIDLKFLLSVSYLKPGSSQNTGH